MIEARSAAGSACARRFSGNSRRDVRAIWNHTAVDGRLRLDTGVRSRKSRRWKRGLSGDQCSLLVCGGFRYGPAGLATARGRAISRRPLRCLAHVRRHPVLSRCLE
ncbi:MAG: phage shock protein PspD [Panacagrimonas sp.]